MTTTPVGLWSQPAIRWLFAISVLGFGGMFVTLSALPAEAVRHGAGPGVGGVVTTVLLGATVVTQVFVGRIVTRIGLLPTLIVGLVAVGAPSPLYLVNYGLPWWLAVSVVRGAGFGIIAVLGAILIARLSEPRQLGRAIGLYGLAIAVASMICTPLGAAFATSGQFGWVAVIATSPVLAVVGIPRLAPRVRSAQAAADTPRTPTGQVVRQVIGPSIVLLSVTFTGGGLVSYLPIDRPSGSSAAIALFVFTTAGALCRFGAGTLADRFGAMRVLPAGLVVAVGGAVALGLATGSSGTVWLALAAALFGLGFGAVQSLTLMLSFGRVGAGGTATASAVWNGAFDLGTSIGAFAIGAVAATGVGLGWTIAGCAGLIALSAAFLREPRVVV